MASENTGYKGYLTLLKVTDDGTNRPLDANNNLCSESGLPQATKPNIESDPDYVAPVYDLTACPLPPASNYSHNISIQSSTAVNACSQTGFQDVVYATVSSIVVGSELFTDSLLTLPLAGGNLWYKLELTGESIQVSDAGVVLVKEICAPLSRGWVFSNPGRATAQMACGSTNFTNVFYMPYSGGTYPAMGMQMYYDEELTSPVAGDDFWYNSEEAYINGPAMSYRIGLTGKLEESHTCS